MDNALGNQYLTSHTRGRWPWSLLHIREGTPVSVQLPDEIPALRD